MSNVVPEGQQPVQPQTAAPETPPALHESWTKALDEGGIPDLLRSEQSPLVQQIRRSEAESNKRIEELSAQRAPEEWSGLLAEAQSQGVSPDQLIEAYNTGLQIRENPFGFIDGYLAQVNQEVSAGRLSAPDGWMARYQAVLQAGGSQQQAQQVANAGAADDEFEDPRDKQMRELQERLDNRDRQEQEQYQAQQQADADAQEAADDEAYAETFETTLRDLLVTQGFGTDAATVDPQLVAAVASVAGQIDQATETEIPLPDLLGMAINQLKQLGVAAPAAQQQRQIPPVGGGSTGRPVATGGFATKEDRHSAMIAAANAALAQ